MVPLPYGYTRLLQHPEELGRVHVLEHGAVVVRERHRIAGRDEKLPQRGVGWASARQRASPRYRSQTPPHPHAHSLPGVRLLLCAPTATKLPPLVWQC